MKRPRVLLVIFTVLFSMLGLVSAQNVQPNWKTYQSRWSTFSGSGGNKELRFQVRYPQDWFVVIDRSQFVVLANFQDETRLGNVGSGDLWVYVGSNFDNREICGEWKEVEEVKKHFSDSILNFSVNLDYLKVSLRLMGNDLNLEDNKALLYKISKTVSIEYK